MLRAVVTRGLERGVSRFSGFHVPIRKSRRERAWRHDLCIALHCTPLTDAASTQKHLEASESNKARRRHRISDHVLCCIAILGARHMYWASSLPYDAGVQIENSIARPMKKIRIDGIIIHCSPEWYADWLKRRETLIRT